MTEFRGNYVFQSVGVQGSIESESVGTDDATVTHPWDSQVNYSFPVEQIADTADYDNEPHFLRLNNGDFLEIYRNGSDHISNDGQVVYRRSTDGGDSWGSQTTIASGASYDHRNQSVGIDRDSGRIIVFYQKYDATNNSNIGQFYKYSDSHGESWSAEVEVTSKLNNTVTPFGDIVRTSNGLMQLFGNTGEAEALFSTDGGQTWGSRTTVYTAASSDFVEPSPVRLDDDRIVVIGRVANENKSFSLKSSDGGASWGSATKFDLHIGETPIYGQKTRANEVTLAVGDRERMEMRVYQLHPERLWNDPVALARSDYSVLDYSIASSTAEFGYPTIGTVGLDQRGTLVTWYDGDGTDTDIKIGSLSETIADRSATPVTKLEQSSSVTQSILDTDMTQVQFDVVSQDDTSIAEVANDEVTVSEDGKYHIKGQARLDQPGDGTRFVGLIEVGTDSLTEHEVPAAGTGHRPSTDPSRTIRLQAGDTIRMKVWQNSGGAVDLYTAAAAENPHVHMSVTQLE